MKKMFFGLLLALCLQSSLIAANQIFGQIKYANTDISYNDATRVVDLYKLLLNTDAANSLVVETAAGTDVLVVDTTVPQITIGGVLITSANIGSVASPVPAIYATDVTSATSVTSPIVRGSTLTSGDLRLDSTSHGTPGLVRFGGGSADYYDEANTFWKQTRIDVASPTHRSWSPAYTSIQCGGLGFLMGRISESPDSFLYLGHNAYYGADALWHRCVADDFAMIAIGGVSGSEQNISFVTAASGDADSEITQIGRFHIEGALNMFSGATVGAAAVMNEVASATNPTLIPHETDVTTGFGGVGNATPALSYVSGIVAGAETVRLDADAVAGNTRFLLYDVNTTSLQRVKVGANDTGPGGNGRALYIDDTP